MTRCMTCPHQCDVAPGQLGRCRARIGAQHSVISESYGRITSLALDPIEKKPIARWRSGTFVLSLGSYGCNMHCPFCQNASIAQVGATEVPYRRVTPESIVSEALAHADDACIGIAYTYNEPLVAWEFVRDTATLAHRAGLANVLVSNGMATPQVTEVIAEHMDAVNIDLKCFDAEGYRKLGGNFDAVRNTIAAFVEAPHCHVEVTTLVVPGLSDDEAQIDAASQWLATMDPTIPYHLTRFFPMHRMTGRGQLPTPRSTLDALARVAARHLNDVIIGNV